VTLNGPSHFLIGFISFSRKLHAYIIHLGFVPQTNVYIVNSSDIFIIPRSNQANGHLSMSISGLSGFISYHSSLWSIEIFITYSYNMQKNSREISSFSCPPVYNFFLSGQRRFLFTGKLSKLFPKVYGRKRSTEDLKNLVTM